ncbi:MAG: hypothetical protein K1000chlam2_00277 [Chlamydiae bacterium]|nr:hypothetical protein [Chlamydiota bacterium]
MTAPTPATQAAPKFELPTGIEIKDDKLVDNRSFYKGVTLFGNDSLATMQGKYDANVKALKDQEPPKVEEKKPQTWNEFFAAPFVFVRNMVSKACGLVVTLFKNIFSSCGLCKDAETKTDPKSETKSETKPETKPETDPKTAT